MLILFKMGLLGDAHGWGDMNLPHTSYNDKTGHSYNLPKEELTNV